MIVDVKKMGTAEIQKAQDACHGVHNVPDVPKVDGKPKHEIKWIWQETYERLFPGQAHDLMSKTKKDRPMPALCNHCANPPCVRVCPTKATFRRDDGIVAMDPHRCIGCRFCMAGCPYGSRSFNFVDPRPHIKKFNDEYPARTIGVVEKCSFCSERLAKNQDPACVEALEDKKALIFGKSDEKKITEVLNKPGAVVAVRKAELSTLPSVFYIL
jgi:molybdopterin-containing oxidoreductase family iron-sulfur binding subunit